MTKDLILFNSEIRITYEQSIQKSIEAQKNDLRLRDSTDATGLQRYNYILRKDVKGELIVQEPYIFKLTKCDTSIIFLGTFHSLPLSIYPTNLLTMLMERINIFTENISDASFEACSGIKKASSTSMLPYTIENFETKDTPEWFDELSVRNQNQLVDVCRVVPKKEDMCYEFIKLYYSMATTQFIPMDIHLAHYHHILYPQHNVMALESYNDTFENLNSKIPEKVIESLINILDEDVKYKGSLAHPSNLINAIKYLNGSIMHMNIPDEFVCKRNKEWVKKIINFVEVSDAPHLQFLKNSVLIIAGIGHFHGEESIINIMHHEHGFEVERSNLSGEFHYYDL